MKTYKYHTPKSLLTNREKEVIELIVNEYSTIEIANQLYLSMETIKSHRRSIMSKLNARNVAGIVREAILGEHISIGNRAYAS
jgi:DNA-binding CsgD family transcriptional regulator